MATLEQLDDLCRFVQGLPESHRTQLSMDEIYGLWREEQVFDEDVRAIQEALDDYDRGERGRPVEEFLKEFHAGEDRLSAGAAGEP